MAEHWAAWTADRKVAVSVALKAGQMVASSAECSAVQSVAAKAVHLAEWKVA